MRCRSVHSSNGAPPPQQAEVGAVRGCFGFADNKVVSLWLNCKLLSVCAGAPAAGCRALPRRTCAVQVQVRSCDTAFDSGS